MIEDYKVVTCDQCKTGLTYIDDFSSGVFVCILLFCKSCNEYAGEKSKRVPFDIHPCLTQDSQYRPINPVLK